MIAKSLKLAQVVTDTDVNAALRDVEAACSTETANLLKAVFGGFRLLANGAHLASDIVSGTDETGKVCLFLVLKFPDAEPPGTPMQP